MRAYGSYGSCVVLTLATRYGQLAAITALRIAVLRQKQKLCKINILMVNGFSSGWFEQRGICIHEGCGSVQSEGDYIGDLPDRVHSTAFKHKLITNTLS